MIENTAFSTAFLPCSGAPREAVVAAEDRYFLTLMVTEAIGDPH